MPITISSAGTPSSKRRLTLRRRPGASPAGPGRRDDLDSRRIRQLRRRPRIVEQVIRHLSKGRSRRFVGHARHRLARDHFNSAAAADLLRAASSTSRTNRAAARAALAATRSRRTASSQPGVRGFVLRLGEVGEPVGDDQHQRVEGAVPIALQLQPRRPEPALGVVQGQASVTRSLGSGDKSPRTSLSRRKLHFPHERAKSSGSVSSALSSAISPSTRSKKPDVVAIGFEMRQRLGGHPRQ